MKVELTIFKNASSTFFPSSILLPASIREDVYKFYSFLRTADDYVDKIPADSEDFFDLRKLWTTAIKTKKFDTQLNSQDSLNERVVKNMATVTLKYKLDPSLIETFLDTMQSDLEGKIYKTPSETLKYIYGSAEIVGLVMAKIMNLPNRSLDAAKAQGRAFQLINFIRDIEEDNALGRQYLPSTELNRFGLSELNYPTSAEQTINFNNFIRFQISKYRQWQKDAYAGYKYIPWRMRLPLRIAAEIYERTATKIDREPLLVFTEKVKPSRLTVAAVITKNLMKA